jgi:hypothetical protein
MGGVTAGNLPVRLASYMKVRNCGCHAPGAARCSVRVYERAPKRPSAAFLLRARAKMAENDAITFSNFSLKMLL